MGTKEYALRSSGHGARFGGFPKTTGTSVKIPLIWIRSFAGSMMRSQILPSGLRRISDLLFGSRV